MISNPFTKKFMATRVNLDALIPRDDFDETAADNRPPGTRKDKLSVTDLIRGEFFFGALRKPDFQRETSEWDPKKIVGLIESFLVGDLIPSVILWQSKNNLTFVIDGSHRLSALAAWINDDYGDGVISKALNEDIIADEQIEIAEAVRNLVRKSIGSYSDHKLSTTHPEKVSPKIIAQAKVLATISIQLQWVEGDSKNAESSFRKINEQGVPINATEKKILNARTKPIGYAARAITKAGRGHNYWQKFDPAKQTQLRNLAKEVNELLFRPKLNTPIKTLDLPLAGKMFSAQALPLTWDFIRIVNPLDSVDADDVDGAFTVKFLEGCRKAAQLINSNDPSSLGLHPVVYLYSEGGRHKPASFYALVALVMDLEQKGKLPNFIAVRSKFETLLIENDYVVQQIVRKYRSAIGSYEAIKSFYLECIRRLEDDKPIPVIIEEIRNEAEFKFITKLPEDVYGQEAGQDRDFSAETKSRTFIKVALVGAPRCAICGGYVHASSVSVDHITDKKFGGDGSPENAQITHPYCNSAKDILIGRVKH